MFNLTTLGLAASVFLNPVFVWFGAVLERFFFAVMFIARGWVPERFPLTPFVETAGGWQTLKRYAEALFVVFLGVSCIYSLHRLGVTRT